jgi:DNA-binding transcriptional regulator YhcF (GntR family)
MGASPQFTEAMVLAQIEANPGKRFQVAPLAAQYQVSRASIRETLENLYRQGLIRCQSGNGATSYFIPSAEEKAVEANEHRARPFKPLSASNMPNLDYNSRRAGSADMLKVPSKHI